jgi:hypothetical protein
LREFSTGLSETKSQAVLALLADIDARPAYLDYPGSSRLPTPKASRGLLMNVNGRNQIQDKPIDICLNRSDGSNNTENP